MLFENPAIKRITFADYDKFFKDLLASPDDGHVLFYKRSADKFVLSFSYDAFIITAEITIERIREMYAEQLDHPGAGTPIEVATDDTGDEPAVRKFLADYLQRGIPEVD